MGLGSFNIFLEGGKRSVGTQTKTPIGSRWMLKSDTHERVFFVLGRKPFGKIELKQEDRAYFASSTQKDLLADFNRLPGKTELPPGFAND